MLIKIIFRNRSNRRRSSTPKSKREVKRAPSASGATKNNDHKSPRADPLPPVKTSDDPDDIAELERRVLEAKKVLEVMVKEKMKEKRRSTSSERKKQSKKRSKKSKRGSNSD